MSLVARALIGMIAVYRRFVSPMLGPRCRFYPSCSEYAVEVVRREGAWRGGRRALARLARCHPLSRSGGLDLP